MDLPDEYINQIKHSNCLTGLSLLPDNSIDCCVTSPPYWGLRDYGTATWEGGDVNCDHSTPRSRGDDIKSGDKQATMKGSRPNTQKVCKCGAVRIDHQLGMESTPAKYVDNMVNVFNEVRRVLTKKGTLWLNLGDSYAGNMSRTSTGRAGYGDEREGVFKRIPVGLKSKDLVGIPWMVAFALRASGWYLRQDIIWSKPNPMPESVKDRCTKAHEYIFLMTKAKRYYYDQESIKEDAVWVEDRENGMVRGADQYRDKVKGKYKDSQYGGGGTSFQGHNGYYKANGELINPDGKRNKRSVWTVTPKAFKEAHFATFPQELIFDCIKAGCPKNGVVLDPFMGAGTTALVARKLDRNYVGFEINEEYIKMATRRIYGELGLFV